jgi:hypothetical protein
VARVQHGWQDSNLLPPVLETGVQPVAPHPYELSGGHEKPPDPACGGRRLRRAGICATSATSPGRNRWRWTARRAVAMGRACPRARAMHIAAVPGSATNSPVGPLPRSLICDPRYGCFHGTTTVYPVIAFRAKLGRSALGRRLPGALRGEHVRAKVDHAEHTRASPPRGIRDCAAPHGRTRRRRGGGSTGAPATGHKRAW